MSPHSALPLPRQARASSRRIRRGTAALLVLAALIVAALALRDPASDGVAVGAATRFDYVAVFPPGTDAAAVETWRGRVLRVHEAGCFRGNPCIARSLRGAELGRARQFAIGFDLMRDTPPTERVAVLAAAQQALPGVRLSAGASLRQAAE
ncbi:MAG TPA: hypothetical protein VLF18_21905 [Tahibacter sp.]|uniref:hypothetical protein n=1 Tax=Tahibacter sp. TaxID=2056211 RepID=UPI002CD29151|nr:hypothetical protein [Tahibacter sp.]HSX62847.1 hypothetical protein [Tahibacter sp.]